MVEGRGFDSNHVLVARSLSCVSKGQFAVVQCLNTSAAPVLVKPGMIIIQFHQFEPAQVTELPIGSATSKVSAMRLSSMSVGLHTACAVQQKDLTCQLTSSSCSRGPLRSVMMILKDLESERF